MTTREKMINYRKENGLSYKVLSAKSGVSGYLLEMVENGHVTHPSIAEKIMKAYKLTQEDIKELIPPNHIKGENYDPDKYKVPEVDILAKKPRPKLASEIDKYLHDRSLDRGRFGN